jgi:nitrite reductase/ring-hydroxylating ferredoxin subunit
MTDTLRSTGPTASGDRATGPRGDAPRTTGTATVQPGLVTRPGWWPLASLADVSGAGRIPLSVSIDGSPWAVVLLDGEVAALRDLCPHRRVPLSAGSVADLPTGQVLECGYHGWSYDRAGHCAAIPAIGENRVPRGMGSVAALETAVADGIVWGRVAPDADAAVTSDAAADAPVPTGSAAPPSPGADALFLRPQKVSLPWVEVVTELSGLEVAARADGLLTEGSVELPVTASALSYFVRPIDAVSTSVFPVVPADAIETGLPEWLGRLAAVS